MRSGKSCVPVEKRAKAVAPEYVKIPKGPSRIGISGVPRETPGAHLQGASAICSSVVLELLEVALVLATWEIVPAEWPALGRGLSCEHCKNKSVPLAGIW